MQAWLLPDVSEREPVNLDTLRRLDKGPARELEHTPRPLGAMLTRPLGIERSRRVTPMVLPSASGAESQTTSMGKRIQYV